jgi:hypothetical protein
MDIQSVKTYAETLVITPWKPAVVLVLVAYFQKQLFQKNFRVTLVAYLTLTCLAVIGAPLILL